MPIFELKLQQSYFDHGFFNVTIDYDRYVRKTEGTVRLRIGCCPEIQAKLSHHANRNGTARIFGGVPLRDWFHGNFERMDIVAVDLSSEGLIILDAS